MTNDDLNVIMTLLVAFIDKSHGYLDRDLSHPPEAIVNAAKCLLERYGWNTSEIDEL